MSATNKALARRFLESAFRLDAEAATALTTAGFRWWVLGEPDLLRASGVRDREGFQRTIRGMRKVLPDGMRHDIRGITAEDDRIAVEVEAEGDWATGETYRNSYHFLIRVEGGRVAEVREYMDTLAVARLTGTVATPTGRDLPAP